MTVPVILLTFANNQGAFLENLVQERKGICDALQSFDDSRYIRLQVEPNAELEDLFELFDRFPDQVAIFHYGGHADGNALQLESPGGGNAVAHAGGLAQLLGLSKALKLVFLNGCATRDQVKSLLDHGVKAVIATSAPINDGMASEFSQQFYATLASGKTVADAFAAARALIQSRYGDSQAIEAVRGMSWGDEAAPAPAELTWGLYSRPDGDDALAWVLPRQAEDQVIIRGAALGQADRVPVNQGLIEASFNAVAPLSPVVGKLFEAAKSADQADLREVRQEIIDAFPSPVGEQLRKLFASSTIDANRLRQLVVTYESVIKLFGFALLSQLWNALFDQPSLAVTDAQWQAVEAYQALDEKGEAVFDYLGLLVSIEGILTANGLSAFMGECSNLTAALGQGDGATAHQFMNEMRAELARGGPDPGEVESFCVQAETHLGTILSDLAFIVRYKLATIKSIAINKARHTAAEFRHRQVLLDRVTAGFLDSEEVRAAFTDNESVILLKDLEDVRDYLNLTPFIIDQNALTGNENTKLYYFRFHDAAQDASHFYSIADPADTLVISPAMDAKLQPIYLPILGLIHEFRDWVARK